MGHVKSYRDLEIWHLAMSLVENIYEVSADFPTDERFGLTGQIRRAAVSIPSNIGEGWGRGRSKAQAAFVRIARGSLYEVETLLLVAERLDFLRAKPLPLLGAIDLLGRKLNSYLSVIENSVSEECAEYVS